MTDRVTFRDTHDNVLRRIISAQDQQIADLKRALADSVQKERAARRKLYQTEGAQLPREISTQEESTENV